MTKTILNHTLVKLFFVVALAVGLVAGVVLPMTPVVYANGVVEVETTNDEYGAGTDCSLREAVYAVNHNHPNYAGCIATGKDIIHLPAGTYILTQTGVNENNNETGDLDISSTMTISGDGASVTIIDGNAIDRVLDIHSGNVTIKGVTIINGQALWSGLDGENGGGIRNNSELIIINTTITSNATSGGDDNTNTNGSGGNGGGGGGIYNSGSGRLTIINSTISNNTNGDGGKGGTSSGTGGYGGNGGGINNEGVLTITNSTISSNTTGDGNEGDDGGDGGDGGGIFSSGTLSITNITLCSNTTGIKGNADGGDPGDEGNGGGVYARTGTWNSKNSILANNSTAGSGPDCYGDLVSNGYNLVMTDTNCTITGITTTVITGVNPLLRPLADNGGETKTHALQPASPAIDGARCNGSGLATDQRGSYRVVPIPYIAHTHEITYSGDGCDIGAYEAQPKLTMQKTVNPRNPNAGDMVTYTIIIANSGILSATGAVLSDPLNTSLTISPGVSINPPDQELITVPHVAVTNLTISPNLTITITIPVIISTSVASDTIITNTASLTCAEISTPTTLGGNNGSSSTTIIVGQADIDTYLPLIFK